MSIAKSAYQYNPYILIASGDEEEYYQRTALAKACNALLDVHGIKATFAIGKTNQNTVCISARSSKDINVQIIMEKLGGGGHQTMAAAQIKNTTIEENKIISNEKF